VKNFVTLVTLFIKKSLRYLGYGGTTQSDGNILHALVSNRQTFQKPAALTLSSSDNGTLLYSGLLSFLTWSIVSSSKEESDESQRKCYCQSLEYTLRTKSTKTVTLNSCVYKIFRTDSLKPKHVHFDFNISQLVPVVEAY
jgi:hypothetical protein